MPRTPRPDNATLRDLAAQGLTNQEIADHLGAGRASVQRWMVAAGIQRPTGRAGHSRGQEMPPLRMPDEATLRQLYEVELLTCPEIAERYHVHAKSVARWLRNTGIATRRGGAGHLAAIRPEPEPEPEPVAVVEPELEPVAACPFPPGYVAQCGAKWRSDGECHDALRTVMSGVRSGRIVLTHADWLSQSGWILAKKEAA
jgi:transposase